MVDTPGADGDDRIDEATSRAMSDSDGDELRVWTTSVSAQMSV